MRKSWFTLSLEVLRFYSIITRLKIFWTAVVHYGKFIRFYRYQILYLLIKYKLFMRKMMLKRIFIFLFMGITSILFSQEYNFSTHFSILEGELTSDDVFEKDFGRFDVYELQMEEGDILRLKLTAEFFPLMIINSPSSDYEMAFPKDNNPFVVFEQEIDESGLWYIYVTGDSLDSGSHSLELCYISSDCKEVPSDANFITLVNFFLAHSETNFDFLKENNCKIKDGKWSVSLDAKGKYDTADIVTKDGTSKLTINFDLETDLFDNMVAELKENFKKNWNVRVSKSNDSVKLIEIEGLRKMLLKKDNKKITLEISTK